jgi:hypothetical protein
MDWYSGVYFFQESAFLPPNKQQISSYPSIFQILPTSAIRELPRILVGTIILNGCRKAAHPICKNDILKLPTIIHKAILDLFSMISYPEAKKNEDHQS